MADVKQDPRQSAQAKPPSLLPKRCGERVKFARLSPAVSVPPLPSGGKIEAGKNYIHEIALHPWGLAVVCGKDVREVLVLPGASVTSVVLAAEES